MVEDINNNTEGDLQLNEPKEHVRVMRERYPDRDLTKYFTDYSIIMAEDSINTFYGGTLRFDEDVISYDKEKSKEHIEMVKDRLGWLVGFEYTPKKIRENTEEFLEEFKEKNLSSGKQWNEVVDSWVKRIRPLVEEVKEGEK